MLYDANFLQKLDTHHEHTYYVRIQALTFDERPLEQLEGRITSGSINLDGKSAIRRSCSLSFIAEATEINDYYWTFKQKFKVEIGLENKVDDSYPSRIYFNMGTFFITSFSSTFTTNSASISIQGKDKMCLLNGELGGIINAETDFGTYDYTDANGVTTNYKLTIQEIVTDLIYSYAQEPLSNIIIQDLDDVGLEQLDYKNDDPMFLIRSFTSERYVLPLFSSADVTVYCCKEIGKDQYKFSVQKLNNDKVIIYDSLTRPLLDNNYIVTRFTFEEMDETQTYTAEQLNQMQLYCAAKITYGEAVGYRVCPLVYAGDLIAKAGDTITSVLDKIIKMLGEFEYFYDVDGRFVLRHKKSFINTVWLPEMVTISSDEGRDRYWLDYQYATPYIYEFKDTKLITNVQNSPQLASIKNDYTVWGERVSAAGGKVPIHSRYAIDTKPIIYVSVAPDAEPNVWTTLSEAEFKHYQLNMPWLKQRLLSRIQLHASLDWRELIYQMAKEYRQYNHNHNNLEFEDYQITLAKRNEPYYPNGHTGYEQYYIDLEGFWRQLYWPYDNTDEDVLNEMSVYNKVVDYSEINSSNLSQYYINGVYRPNSAGLKIYSEQGTTELELKTTEHPCKLYGTTDKWVILDSTHWYYVDENGKGFNIPTELGISEIPQIGQFATKLMHGWYTYDTIRNFLERSPNADTFVKFIYTTAYDISSQLWYKYSDISQSFIPYLDQYDYCPILATENYPIEGMTIKEYYERTFVDGEAVYNAISESYKSSKYMLYILNDVDTNIKNILQQKDMWLSLISLILERNQLPYSSWSNWQKWLNDNDFIELLTSITNNVLQQDSIERRWWQNEIMTTADAIIALRIALEMEASSPELLLKYDWNHDGQITITDALLIMRSVYDLDMVNISLPSSISLIDLKNFIQNVTNNYGEIVDNLSDELIAQYDLDDDGQINEVEIFLWTYIYNSLVLADNSELSKLNPLAHFIVSNIIACPSAIYDYFVNSTSTKDQPLIYDDLIGLTVQINNTELISELFQLLNFNSLYQLQWLLNMYYDFIYDNFSVLKDVHMLSYQLFINQLAAKTDLYYNANSNESKKMQFNKFITLFNSHYIYDNLNYYNLQHIKMHPILSAFYHLNEQPIEQLAIIPYDIHGNPTYLTRHYEKINYYTRDLLYYGVNDGVRAYWNKAVYEAPYTLNFWFDFLDTDGSISAYATSEIGDRPIVVNDTNLKSIFYREIPKILIYTFDQFQDEKIELKSGYSYILLPAGYEQYFSISSRGLSIKNKIDDLLYQHTYCNQTINLTCVPIYYLDVNSRIYIGDKRLGIDDDFAIQSISYSLNYNGTMSLSTAKIQPNSIFEREE